MWLRKVPKRNAQVVSALWGNLDSKKAWYAVRFSQWDESIVTCLRERTLALHKSKGGNVAKLKKAPSMRVGAIRTVCGQGKKLAPCACRLIANAQKCIVGLCPSGLLTVRSPSDASCEIPVPPKIYYIPQKSAFRGSTYSFSGHPPLRSHTVHTAQARNWYSFVMTAALDICNQMPFFVLILWIPGRQYRYNPYEAGPCKILDKHFLGKNKKNSSVVL